MHDSETAEVISLGKHKLSDLSRAACGMLIIDLHPPLLKKKPPKTIYIFFCILQEMSVLCLTTQVMFLQPWMLFLELLICGG